MKVRVLWSLRGRTVVEIPDGTEPEDWEEAIAEPMGENFTTDEWQWDSDGYEIDDVDEEVEDVDVHPNKRPA